MFGCEDYASSDSTKAMCYTYSGIETSLGGILVIASKTSDTYHTMLGQLRVVIPPKLYRTLNGCMSF
jgi:hypothetical protein